MIDELINKQVEEHDKVGVCDCGCHTSPHSDADMKINGCELCYKGSEYAPRHPDKRNILVSSMKKVGEEIVKKIEKELKLYPTTGQNYWAEVNFHDWDKLKVSLTDKGE